MKASEATLLEFMKASPQFIIPIYQRTYAWTERECQQLWQDIIRTGSNEEISAHFIGSIVYIQKGLYQATMQSPLLVIDGQQRLTTMTLLIAALSEALDKLEGDAREPLDGFAPQKLRHYYLLNREEGDERYFKLILSQTDKESLKAIVGQKELPAESSLRITENFKLFQSWIAELKSDLLVLCKGIAKLLVVDISLSRDQDNPQLIFESMNSTGRELTQADLIRNYLLMGLVPKLQTKLYEDFWRPMEVEFGQEAYVTHFDPFMRHFLTVKTGEIPNIREVYEVFKAYSQEPEIREAGVEELVADLRRFARYFCRMALGTEPKSDLKRAFQDLRELKVDVAYPFLLQMYHDCDTDALPEDDFIAAVRMVEAYVFRRAVCSIPTNSLNKTFATAIKAVRKDRYLESVTAYFLLLRSYRLFPRDDEFCREFKVRNFYNFNRRAYWLRRLENHNRKEHVPVEEYTIEHIMPQNDNLSAEWREALGDNWEQDHEELLHSAGNLTLTGYNSEYSDRPFSAKRDMAGGFKESPLRLNEGLGGLEEWNGEAIRKRSERLATQALAVWKVPELPEDILIEYGPKSSSSQYTLSDHPNLALEKTRPLYEAFRREALALDPCVVEEFLKLYVAYKAETNFVDIIPKSKRLVICLNMPFVEIDDPKGICEDVTGRKQWGNGSVRAHLSDIQDLPYVMGLVRQSLDRQLGDGNEA